MKSRRRKSLLVLAGLIVLLTVVLANPCHAAKVYPVWSFADRIQIAGNAGWLTVNPPGDELWQGPDLGGTLTYSLHPRLSVFGGYDHGFALSDFGHGQLDVAKVCANLLVYPGINDIPRKLRMSVGSGPLWYGSDWAESWSGWDVHLSASYDLMERVVLFGTYAHGFSRSASTPDVDEVKVALNVLAWRK